MYRRFGKRALDVALSATGLAFAAPVLAVASAWVKLDSPGPVLFVQRRAGRYGRPFDVFKLRTMTDRKRTPDREILGGDAEVTRAGHWLRRLKLDELPQLVNVLRGEMSLVGPRPMLPAQLADLNATGRKRLAVRPGLTGLAQVHGNIYLSWPERWRYDARYVEDLSLRLDAWILLRTVGVVVLGERRFRQPVSSAER